MALPSPPKPAKISRLSPSTYEAARLCKARTAWLVFGERNALPESPSAILGSCFHELAAAAQSGQFRNTVDALETQARRRFDEEAEKRFAQAHEMFKAKFGTKERLPYYYMQREAAVALVRKLSEESSYVSIRHAETPKTASRPIEQSLKSKDGLLSGRPDLIAASVGEVVDYKTRRESADAPNEVTEREARQLRLYAYLADENEIKIRRGVIILASGRQLTIDISAKEAQAEAHIAVDALHSYNAVIGDKTTFEEIAEPSPENCRYCPCIMLCEPFWQQADNSWQEYVGTQVQGRLTSVSKANVQGMNLVTMHLNEVRGTISNSIDVVLEQVPEDWLLGGLGASLTPGTLVRIINAYAVAGTLDRTILRADRAATEVWIADR